MRFKCKPQGWISGTAFQAAMIDLTFKASVAVRLARIPYQDIWIVLRSWFRRDVSRSGFQDGTEIGTIGQGWGPDKKRAPFGALSRKMSDVINPWP